MRTRAPFSIGTVSWRVGGVRLAGKTGSHPAGDSRGGPWPRQSRVLVYSELRYSLYRTLPNNRGTLPVVPSRHFDDRIRKLSAKALSTKDPDELKAVLSELQSAMHERIAALRKQAAAAFGGQLDSKGKKLSSHVRSNITSR